MRLRCTILLDWNAEGRSVFGAHGTPMAVLLDADGRVASKMVAGAEAAFALSGSGPAALREPSEMELVRHGL
jgi:hypothetical protein